MTKRPAPRIYVLAGVNGAGKSSIAGATFRLAGGQYFNLDEAACQQGRRLLERAIAERLDYAFESTLVASTLPRLLARAASEGFEVRVWYAGLSNPELHMARVRARVARGGHDIPEADIRRRYEHSRLNLIVLLPHLAALRVYDNSAEADPAVGQAPRPLLVLHLEHARIMNPRNLAHAPGWARPIVAAALKGRLA